jgi:hypothetical protein
MSRIEANVSRVPAQPIASYGQSFFQHMSAGSRQSATEIVPLLLDLIAPNSVVDIGCGVGTGWLCWASMV